MRQQNHALRIGITAILCALTLRLWASGIPERIGSWLTQPDTAAFLLYLETGRDVRFSPSIQGFSPNFMESPAPATPEATEASLPTFSDAQEVSLYYAADKNPDIDALMVRPLSWELRGEAPTVLIVHTHSTESYTKKGEAYTETSRWRTLDEDYNMLCLGALAAELLEENGIPVIQHRELNDYPSYNGAYTRMRKTISAYLKEYPSIQLVLDLHRDASGGERGQLRTLAQVEGQDAAQLMLVLGTNHKHYEENLSLALKLHAQLERTNPGIMRPLQLRAQRFNQDLSPGALIVEVGAAGNSLPEAKIAVKALAEAITALAAGANPEE